MSDIAKSIKPNNQSISTNSIVTNTQKTGIYSVVPDAENKIVTPAEISSELGKRFNRKRNAAGASSPEQPVLSTWNIGISIPATIDSTLSNIIAGDNSLIGTDNDSFKMFSIFITGQQPSITVNWGDGSIETFTSGGTKTHTYTNSGSYTVKISGSFGSLGNIQLGTGYAVAKYYVKSTSAIPFIANLDNFNKTFENCIAITSLPSDLFSQFTSIASSSAFSYTFRGCTSLSSVPADLFRYNTELSFNAFYGTFTGCSSLTSLPANLFRYNTKLNKMAFILTFKGCGITTIPSDLFRYNTEITTGFNNTFDSCASLTTIPSGLFRYNTKMVNGFNSTFLNCTSLSSVDADIFRYNTQLSNGTNPSFRDIFSGVTLPTQTYSNILISLNSYLGNNLQFNAGNSQFNSSALSARSSLISKKWNIIDASNLVLQLDATQTSYFTLDRTGWYDLSGKGNFARLANGASRDGSTVSCDGVNDYIEIKNSSSINNCLNQNFTFDMWVWIHSNQFKQYGKIFSKGGYFSPGFNGVTLVQSGNTTSVVWQYRLSNGSVVSLLNTTIPTNTWINLVYTRSNGVIKCYLNGQETASANDNYDLRSSYNFRIGGNYQNDNFAKQKIRQFSQYNTALSANEILSNYNNNAAT